MDLTRSLLTDHCALQAERRGASRELIQWVLEAPEQVVPVREGRVVAQRTTEGVEKTYLVRVFVDVDREPPEIVTAYRTSKIRKYGGAR